MIGSTPKLVPLLVCEGSVTTGMAGTSSVACSSVEGVLASDEFSKEIVTVVELSKMVSFDDVELPIGDFEVHLEFVTVWFPAALGVELVTTLTLKLVPDKDVLAKGSSVNTVAKVELPVVSPIVVSVLFDEASELVPLIKAPLVTLFGCRDMVVDVMFSSLVKTVVIRVWLPVTEVFATLNKPEVVLATGVVELASKLPLMLVPAKAVLSKGPSVPSASVSFKEDSDSFPLKEAPLFVCWAVLDSVETVVVPSPWLPVTEVLAKLNESGVVIVVIVSFNEASDSVPLKKAPLVTLFGCGDMVDDDMLLYSVETVGINGWSPVTEVFATSNKYVVVPATGVVELASKLLLMLVPAEVLLSKGSSVTSAFLITLSVVLPMLILSVSFKEVSDSVPLVALFGCGDMLDEVMLSYSVETVVINGRSPVPEVFATLNKPEVVLATGVVELASKLPLMLVPAEVVFSKGSSVPSARALFKEVSDSFPLKEAPLVTLFVCWDIAVVDSVDSVVVPSPWLPVTEVFATINESGVVILIECKLEL
jgi:hypothetical protein